MDSPLAASNRRSSSFGLIQGLKSVTFRVPHSTQCGTKCQSPRMSGATSSFGKIVCKCNNCSAQIQFASNRAGETIRCPKCGVDTALYIPSVPIGRTGAAASPARIVSETYHEGNGTLSFIELQPAGRHGPRSNVDEKLKGVASVALILGIVGFIGCSVGAIAFAADNKNESAIMLGICGIAAILQGFTLHVLFQAAAEGLQLLREMVAQTFSGKITPATIRQRFKCSACDSPVEPGHASCANCGAEFKTAGAT